MESNCIYTIGHSKHQIDKFLEMLDSHQISALADVRSFPYSRLNPQFNKETLKKSLKEHGIVYVYLGKELGARTEDSSCYVRGKVSFSCIANTNSFEKGMERLQKGMQTHQIVLMCAEKEPLSCHRTILVSRRLVELGITVYHIHEDGHLESHESAMKRLLKILGFPEAPLLLSSQQLMDKAYDLQGQKIAYVDVEMGGINK